MKRWAVIIVGAAIAVLIVVGLAFIFFGGKSESPKTNPTLHTGQHSMRANSSTTTQTAKPQTACEKLLSTAQATTLLGGKPTLGSGNNKPDTSNPHLTVDSCTYTRHGQFIRVVAYIANDSKGVSDNRAVFGSGKPTNAIPVQGYGDSAYWVQNSGVLNILRDNSWYEISDGSGVNTSVAQAEQVARLVLNNL